MYFGESSDNKFLETKPRCPALQVILHIVHYCNISINPTTNGLFSKMDIDIYPLHRNP